MPAAGAGRRFGASDGRQGRSHVHALDPGINVLPRQMAADANARREGAEVASCAVGSGHEQAAQAIEEAVRMEDGEGVAGAPRGDVAPHRLGDGRVAHLAFREGRAGDGETHAFIVKSIDPTDEALMADGPTTAPQMTAMWGLGSDACAAAPTSASPRASRRVLSLWVRFMLIYWFLCVELSVQRHAISEPWQLH